MMTRTAQRQYLIHELCDFILDKSIPEPNSGCWLWMGPESFGYGHANYGYLRMSAHRLSYIVFKKRPEKGMIVRHLCNNSLCVNPDHLDEGTYRDNYTDRIKQLKRGY